MGELSSELEKAKTVGTKGEVRLPPSGSRKSDTLKEAGISTQAASRCERIAAIPEDEFEEIIEEHKARGVTRDGAGLRATLDQVHIFV
jgi:hypothetical protein